MRARRVCGRACCVAASNGGDARCQFASCPLVGDARETYNQYGRKGRIGSVEWFVMAMLFVNPGVRCQCPNALASPDTRHLTPISFHVHA